MTEQALKHLLDSMSIEEKAGQLTQIPVSFCAGGTATPTGPEQGNPLSPEQVVLCGSLICDQPPQAAVHASVIRHMTEAHPHHIPPILMRDIIHGFRTIFPIPLAMGCTFDEAQVERMGQISAVEGSACGIHASFAPMVDVVRDPRWGRVMESPGEAPLLCGAMGAAMVKGMRRDGLDKPGALAACVKHYASYGLCQAGQEYAPADTSRAEMYNVYLPPFRRTLEAGCDMVMPSFIAIDRIPCVCNSWLLKHILRDRWQSDAMVISDYADVGQLMNHDIAADLSEAVELCINAGLDMDMTSYAYIVELPRLVQEGRVDMATIDEAVLRVLRLKNRLGIFENAIPNDDETVQQQILTTSAHKEAALQAALKSCVLLKNAGLLPLKPGMKVALTGDHADNTGILGGWAFDGIPSETRTLLEALSCDERLTLTKPETADVILYAVGEDEKHTGEGGSKTRPWLDDAQMNELKRLHALGKPVVTILFCGRPLILTDVLPESTALLCAWFPGTMGAEAIRQLIMGDVNPSGHLSMTFPRSLGQVPIHHDKLTACRFHDSNNRYTNRYVDEQNEPLFPFGFGMSYTDFTLSDAVCEQHAAAVTVTVTNTGDRAGETVIQLYGRVKHCAYVRATRSLVGFKRVSLSPGESRRVTLPIDMTTLELYNAQGELIPTSGEYSLAVGFDSSAPMTLNFCRI